MADTTSAARTKILLATNGSREALPAEMAATELAYGTDSELHIVYVVATLETLPYSPATARANAESRLEPLRMAGLRFLDEKKTGLESAGGVEVHSHYREGGAEKQVIGLAAEIDADIIICGGRKRRWAERLFGRGFSEYVSAKAPQPVFVVDETNVGDYVEAA